MNCFLFSAFTEYAQTATQTPTAANVSVHNFSTIAQAKYLLFLPKGCNPSNTNRWPTILFLHGIGESGTNVWDTARHGPAQFIEAHADFPFILISPQCPAGEKWSDQLALKILDEVESQYAVDTNRIYLTGLSLGGYGVWSLATTYPERFAAIAPVSGGGDTVGLIVTTWKGKAGLLKKLPVWAFHCSGDPIVPASESERMVNALKQFGCANVKLTIYPRAEHDAWTQAYSNQELYSWFLRFSRPIESEEVNAGAK